MTASTQKAPEVKNPLLHPISYPVGETTHTYVTAAVDKKFPLSKRQREAGVH